MLEFVESAKIDVVLIHELIPVARIFWDPLDTIKATEDYSPLISVNSVNYQSS